MSTVVWDAEDIYLLEFLEGKSKHLLIMNMFQEN